MYAEQTGDRVQTLSAENTGSEAVSTAEQPDNTADAVQKQQTSMRQLFRRFLNVWEYRAELH